MSNPSTKPQIQIRKRRKQLAGAGALSWAPAKATGDLTLDTHIGLQDKAFMI